MSEQDFNEHDLRIVRTILDFISQYPTDYVFKDGEPFAGKTLEEYDLYLCLMERSGYIQGYMREDNLAHSSHNPNIECRIEILDKGKRLLKSPPLG